MKQLLLAVLFAAAPAAAQDFSEPSAAPLLLVQMQALAPLAYDPREIRVDVVVEGGVKRIVIFHLSRRLASIDIGGAFTARSFAVKLMSYLEASRVQAVSQGRMVSINEARVSFCNVSNFTCSYEADNTPGWFGAIIRATDKSVPASR